ncbi:hypothetical protein [Shewanella algae]|uniref:Uncharacterized protein n=1 Tax=Shewanella algae TaxID=38313 RepID=A0A379YJU6_9GAMM|nr:hypothetical protein [Shewanella algae]MBO2606932.1 hypothetical protein [Shewanella algae]PST67097.1 hypothetical protein AYI77_10115 [Shewanella algae]QTE85429.1 hypothetical protein JKK44_15240 [Shewanella algae]SUI46352.1 Uncharacterised protein [Shewanella algae]
MYDFDNPYDDELTSNLFLTPDDIERDRQEFMARLRRSQEIDEQVSAELEKMHKVIADLEAAVLALDPDYPQHHLKVCMGKFIELIKRGIKCRAGSDPDGDAYRPNLFSPDNDDFDVDTFTNENE